MEKNQKKPLFRLKGSEQSQEQWIRKKTALSRDPWIEPEDHEDENEVGKALQTRLISVFSPAGGCGKTTFSIAYTQELAQRYPEKKILYLSLQGTEDWPLYFRNDSDYNLSDLLFRMLRGDDFPIRDFLDTMARRQENGIYLIRPCNNLEDLQFLEEGELDRLLEMLYSFFDLILCDMNSSFDNLNSQLLRKSDQRFYIMNDLSTVQMKWVDFFSQLNRNHLWDRYMDRASLICICERVRESKKWAHQFPGPIYSMPWSNRLFKEQNGLLTIRQDSNYYECIRKLV